jgi:hypothetical protein
MPAKNYSCENSESCSLMSVTNLNTSSHSSSGSVCPDSESIQQDHTSVCPDSSSICNNSSSLCPDSSSLCPDSSSVNSSCVTYSDKTSCSTTVDRSICNKPCTNACKKTDECEIVDIKACDKLVQKYNCSREELLAIADIIVLLNFIKSKLIAVKPNVILRRTENYTVDANIAWLESFIDTLFCVLRKNEAYKVINVKVCKLKNDCDEIISNRTYLLKVKFSTKKGCIVKNIPITFYWSQLTNNLSTAYNSVLDITIRNITSEITVLDAASVRPFLQENPKH